MVANEYNLNFPTVRDSYLITYTGKRVNLLHPEIDTIDIQDIAHSLGMQCRYNGMTSRFYSVAEHCVYMASFGETPEKSLWLLLHDATEAYLGDVISPLKRLLNEYSDYEDVMMAAIMWKFRLAEETPQHRVPKFVHEIDQRMLATEVQQLFVNPDSWDIPYAPFDGEIKGWDPRRAKYEFLATYESIINWRDR